MGTPSGWPFGDLPRKQFGAILADPPWRFRTWNKATAVKRRSSGTNVSAAVHYNTMSVRDISVLPVEKLAAADCALFLWITWPNLIDSLDVIRAWGFEYKTCAFSWTKAHVGQIDMFRDDGDPLTGMGYWTRANSEVCLLATRGRPQRLSKNVKQGIIQPRREHSRKPDCVYGRIEELVCGPYLELFARQKVYGWAAWGDDTEKFAPKGEREWLSTTTPTVACCSTTTDARRTTTRTSKDSAT